MKRVTSFAIAAVAAGFLTAPASAQTVAQSVRGGMDAVQQKMVGLAQTVPESDYTWRPGEGVRSIGEVYMHIVSANFNLPGFLGIQPPQGTPQGWLQGKAEGLTRAQAVEALNASFEFIHDVLEQAGENPDAPVTFFGNNSNANGFMIFMEGHLHEHLGQSIAYARSVGVTPPWSAEQ